MVVQARDDDVYEEEINGRGQDAYVHHFVVAQDINLEHTYYDDIEVNDVTVSVTDNDPAVVIENFSEVNPTEGGAAASIKVRRSLRSKGLRLHRVSKAVRACVPCVVLRSRC